MKYVDVILPLPLQDFFTYAVSDSLASRVVMGTRVLVPFGKSKTYAAMAVRVHADKPNLPDSKIREILAVLDDVPVLLPSQLRLWRWIADYYMSPLGDVMNAALPAGLKAEVGYKPKTEACVCLGDKFANVEAKGQPWRCCAACRGNKPRSPLSSTLFTIPAQASSRARN